METNKNDSGELISIWEAQMFRNRERQFKYISLINVIHLSDYFAEVGRGTKYQGTLDSQGEEVI